MKQDPTEREIELAERAVKRLGLEERRYRDRWGRWFERSMLLVLVVLYFLGFHTQQENDNAIQRNRARIAGQLCRGLNRNAHATNRQTIYIQGLIVAGAKQSRVFEPIYRQFGLPPYAVRLKQARKSAEGLGALSVPVLNCTVVARRTQR